MFATSPDRGEDVASPDDIEVKVIDVDRRFYVVFFPITKFTATHGFWSHTGLGTSSRQAEETLKNISKLKVVDNHEIVPKPNAKLSQSHLLVKRRIADLMERAPASGRLTDRKVKQDDVFLFQTGMASIYEVHSWLLDHFNHDAKSILFGFAFHHTINVFKFFGPEYKFFGKGDDADVVDLENWMREERANGTKFQALWCEYPSNPLIVTPNMRELRRLADEYKFILIVDDTIGSFSNVDLLGVADVVVSSLTKSFNGYADAMGGSAVLNPSSRWYTELKEICQSKYEEEWSNGDADQMEQNSRTYLQRSSILNNNALRLVEHLQGLSANPNSPIAKIHYTTVGTDSEYYKQTMRQATQEFTPGYGCLFTLELKTVEQAIAFFDNLNVHHGPHLGAHLTLALPYTRMLYSKDLEWASGYNMRPTQVRVAVGLEETDDLIRTFSEAVAAAGKLSSETVVNGTIE